MTTPEFIQEPVEELNLPDLMILVAGLEVVLRFIKGVLLRAPIGAISHLLQEEATVLQPDLAPVLLEVQVAQAPEPEVRVEEVAAETDNIIRQQTITLREALNL